MSTVRGGGSPGSWKKYRQVDEPLSAFLAVMYNRPSAATSGSREDDRVLARAVLGAGCGALAAAAMAAGFLREAQPDGVRLNSMVELQEGYTGVLPPEEDVGQQDYGRLYGIRFAQGCRSRRRPGISIAVLVEGVRKDSAYGFCRERDAGVPRGG
eukprot:CAMPEP_0195645356 /NCGR_PEP_ID=MMETSP0815-20121206/28894_1 /TAXON_ID=97485 /ORGANISM="Prymnesium parvum, Strain Texoma1" /LENGTH=154 /DNA_ID=CAMNT_0040788597 /DNA_START=489 /DNA_END=950 /DNA_ORIENTATION=-